MPGGLIQVVAYGSQDLFLTGTPEITFFKVVYRRYTNFSTDTINIPFNGSTGFGETSQVTIPKIADLIHKMHLQITIPSVAYSKDTSLSAYQQRITSAQTAYNVAFANYQIVKNYMILNTNAYRQANNTFVAINASVTNMIQNVIDTFTLAAYNITAYSPSAPTGQNAKTVNDFYGLFNDLLDDAGNYVSSINFQPAMVGMNSIIKSFGNPMPTSVTTNQLFIAMQYGINQSQKAQQFFYSKLLAAQTELTDASLTNRKFAWINRLGHALIDYIEVTIGGTTIDKHYGKWIDIWYELTGNHKAQIIYNQLIGDVPELTTYDRTTKPSFTIYVPLQFWFCRNNGLALPLVSLEYHDVDINVKLRNAEDVSYIELETNEEQIYIDDIFKDLGIDLDVSLLVDFIYLEGSERKKFAQGSHEYLIEQVQIIDQSGINADTQLLLDFNHPCKELVWIAQKESYFQNTDGSIKCRWTNYGTNDDTGENNPIISSGLNFNGYSRFDNFDGMYFNRVQPYTYHTCAPVHGINCYCFSLNPEEHQPSGSCNLSRISKAILKLFFDPKLFITSTGQTVAGVIQTVADDSVQLDLNAKTIDDYYIKWTILLGATTYTIDSYDGATRTATVTITITDDVISGQQYILTSPILPTDATISIFCLNYNILRFISGMGGLAYV